MDSIQKHARSETGASDLPVSPSKRPKLEEASATSMAMDANNKDRKAVSSIRPAVAYDHSHDPNEQQAKEAVFGITEFVSPDLLGFTGVLKKRYTDFLVNEILPSGEVAHLDDLKAPKRKTDKDQCSGTQASATVTGTEDQQSYRKQDLLDLKRDGNTATVEENSIPTKQALSDPEIVEFKSSYVKHEPHVGEFMDEAPSNLAHQDSHGPTHDVVETLIITTLPISASSVEETQDGSPHKHVPTPSPSIFLGGPDLNRKIVEKAENSEKTVRKREKAIIRQTEQGWVEIDQEQRQKSKDQKGAQNLTTEISSEEIVRAAASKDNSGPERVEYEGKSSTPAEWQAFAITEATSNGDTSFRLKPEDRNQLLSYFGPDIVDALAALYNRIIDSPPRRSRNYGTVKSAVLERQIRSRIHQDLRKIFNGRIESTTDKDGALVMNAMAEKPAFHARTPLNNDRKQNQAQQRGPAWKERGGEYLHFSLYKENKDTMEAVMWLCRDLKLKPGAFQFAGTKDKRAVTVQRVSVYRVFIDRLIAAGRTLRGAKIGNFEYHPYPLRLGELKGNEFVVTLRDCDFHYPVPLDSKSVLEGASSVVCKAIDNLNESGFLNYYGLQRFGTFSTSTDKIGKSMLRGDFKEAVDAILDFNPASLVAAEDPTSDIDKVSRDDQARAHALNSFKITGKTYPALETLPRKFSAESSIIRHLSHYGRETDYLGSLQSISRNLRLMYVHAYQSLVWNVAASERWKCFGSTVVEGDLVLINESTGEIDPAVKSDGIDEDGEAIILPTADDRAIDPENMFTRARTLSKEEAESGRYNIFDVVLPTPGYDILYPANKVGTFYKDFMTSERGGGLDPHDMRRKWKDISLSGSYRKFLARPLNKVSYEVKSYMLEDEQLVTTDLDRLQKARDEKTKELKEGPITGGSSAMKLDKMDDEDSKSRNPETGNELSENEPAGDKLSGGSRKDFNIAVILRLQLGSSQYATMALRELMKLGGLKTYKPDFSGGR